VARLSVYAPEFGEPHVLMLITYERDDQRRLITVTLSDPYSVDDILRIIDRQAAEDTWEYALLYDFRAVTQVSTEADLKRMADRVKVAGGGRERGPVGMAVGSAPEHFRMGLIYTMLARKLESVEVLLTAAQRDDWLARNARRGSSRQS
jgi:hypothetical protein